MMQLVLTGLGLSQFLCVAFVFLGVSSVFWCVSDIHICLQHTTDRNSQLHYPVGTTARARDPAFY